MIAALLDEVLIDAPVTSEAPPPTFTYVPRSHPRLTTKPDRPIRTVRVMVGADQVLCPPCRGTGISPFHDGPHNVFACRVCHGSRTLPKATLVRIEAQRADMRLRFPITV